MTEQEALKYLKDANRNNQMVGILPKSDIGKCLIKALEEIRKYRSIGTPEECRAAVEKQKAKKPIPIDYEKYMDTVINAQFLRGAYWCPNCRHVVKSGTHCNHCGQKLDWSDEEC